MNAEELRERQRDRARLVEGDGRYYTAWERAEADLAFVISLLEEATREGARA